jgi:hypothetical protein
MYRQPVERVRRFVHHIKTRAAVDVNINVSRAKQIGVASGYAGGDRLDSGNDACFNAQLMIGKPALLS